MKVCLLLSRAQLFVNLWTVACQPPLPMEFSRQEYWRGSHSLLQGNLPYPGIKPRSPVLQADSLPSEPPGKPIKLSLMMQVNSAMPPLSPRTLGAPAEIPYTYSLLLS